MIISYKYPSSNQSRTQITHIEVCVVLLKCHVQNLWCVKLIKSPPTHSHGSITKLMRRRPFKSLLQASKLLLHKFLLLLHCWGKMHNLLLENSENIKIFKNVFLFSRNLQVERTQALKNNRIKNCKTSK